ncbi:MAG: hypothetical protein QF464_05625, partial [Myxococcota bacterium]|nr:hypothetical protein [Myxococcota bacterium]
MTLRHDIQSSAMTKSPCRLACLALLIAPLCACGTDAGTATSPIDATVDDGSEADVMHSVDVALIADGAPSSDGEIDAPSSDITDPVDTTGLVDTLPTVDATSPVDAQPMVDGPPVGDIEAPPDVAATSETVSDGVAVSDVVVDAAGGDAVDAEATEDITEGCTPPTANAMMADDGSLLPLVDGHGWHLV